VGVRVQRVGHPPPRRCSLQRGREDCWRSYRHSRCPMCNTRLGHIRSCRLCHTSSTGSRVLSICMGLLFHSLSRWWPSRCSRGQPIMCAQSAGRSRFWRSSRVLFLLRYRSSLCCHTMLQFRYLRLGWRFQIHLSQPLWLLWHPLFYCLQVLLGTHMILCRLLNRLRSRKPASARNARLIHMPLRIAQFSTTALFVIIQHIPLFVVLH
jgi:hypothetical protein